jgi:hypothetical protein
MWKGAGKMKSKAGSGFKFLLALSVAAGAAWAVAAADSVDRPAEKAATVVTTASEKEADGTPKTWVLVLAGVGVIGWAALRRLRKG